MIKIPSLLPELDVNTKLSLTIVFSFALAILTYLSIWGLAGRFGDTVGTFLAVLMGKGAAFLPVSLLLIGFMLYRLQKNSELANGINARLIWGVGIAMAGFSGFLNIIFQVNTLANAHEGGGLVGFVVYPKVLGFFGVFGGSFLIFTMFVVSFFLISQMTIHHFFAKIKESTKNPAIIWEFVPDVFEIWKTHPKEDKQDNKKPAPNQEPTQPAPVAVEFEVKNNSETSSQPKKQKFKATSAAGGIIELQADDNPPHDLWKLPPLKLLKENKSFSNPGDIEKNKKIIQETLSHFGITVEMKDVRTGPTVSQYSLKPANGVKLSAIDNVQRDLGLALATPHVRIEAPINGQSLVGIEVPNLAKADVRLKNMLENPKYINFPDQLAIVVGQDVAGNDLLYSLAKMPHLLVAGATGSGKSVWINSMLLSLLYKYSPTSLQLVLVDMKRVELKLYEGTPHLLAPVITEAEKAINALKWTVIEMDKRYKLLEQYGKRNIKDYNAHVSAENLQKLPYIVFVIDELGDLMMLAKSEVEPIIVRLTQMSRAVGIHLVLGTQRPDTHVVTGLIKANVPSRIAFAVASQIDSRVILDQGGAEKLLGQGDGMFMNPNSITPIRFQGPNVDEAEVRECVSFLKQEGERHNYFNLDGSVVQPPKVKIQVPGMVSSSQGDDDAEDEILEEARKLVVLHQKGSASFLQQMMGIGYPKAARIIQQLEDMGIVGPQNGSKPREVYLTDL